MRCEICGQGFAVAGYADAFHAGGAGGFDAVQGVFDDDAVTRRDVEFGGGNQEDFRVGLAAVHVFGGDDGFEAVGGVEGFEDGFDILARGGGGDGLTPSLLVQTAYPLGDAGKRLDALLTHTLAVEGFFGIADALDEFGGDLGAEPLAEDGVVALAEGGEELVVGDGMAFAGHGVLPGLPVVVGGVDEGSVHVPEYGAGAGHWRFDVRAF